MIARFASLLLVSTFAASCGGGSSADDAGGTDLGAADGSRPDSGADLGGAPDLGTDAGCADADGDGHRAMSCGGDDCDDTDPRRYPGNAEVCDAAGHDEDCNPATLGPDADADGFPATTCCNTQPSGTRLCGTDCDDTRATVNPSAVESCNGVDDNCNGTVDEGLITSMYFPDCDADGYGDASATPTTACAMPAGSPASCPTTTGVWATTGTDCRDDAPGVHPGAAGACSCAGTATYDADTDGHVAVACGGDDCNDHDASVHPGAAEVCNGVDDNCDGSVDEGVTITFYGDGDNDGYGDPTRTSQFCSMPDPFTYGVFLLVAGDCNDADPRIHAGAPDCTLDGIDQDCSGTDGDSASCSTPGAVTCGTAPAASCALPANQCCATGGAYAANPIAGSCVAAGTTCPAASGGGYLATVTCDGPEDCPGMGCCLAGGTSACGATPCATTVCHSDADCAAGHCVESTARSGFFVCNAPPAASPGVVRCGSGSSVASCALPANGCCAAAGFGYCGAAGTTCPLLSGFFPASGTYACDGAEDCATGENCCLTRGSGSATSSCSASSCVTQLCHADTDCAAGRCLSMDVGDVPPSTGGPPLAGTIVGVCM